MNTIQTNYVKAKTLCDEMKFNGTDKEFDDACDLFLEAEEKLIEWALGAVEKSGLMKGEDLKTIKENWHRPQWNEKIIDLALSLKA